MPIIKLPANKRGVLQVLSRTTTSFGHQRATGPQFMIMVGTFMALSFCTLVIYGSLARRIAGLFGSARRLLWINRLVGSAFVGLGVSLLRLRQPV